MKRMFLAILGVVMIGVASLGVTSMPVMAGDDEPGGGTEACSGGPLASLGFKPWYDGLCSGGQIDPPASGDSAALGKYVTTIISNVVYDLAWGVSVILVGVVVWSGVQFIMAQGDVAKTAKAKRTMVTAITGAVIAMSATVITNTLAGVMSINTEATSASELGSGFATQAGLTKILGWAYGVGGVIAVLFIIKNGFDYMTSTGDPAKSQKATRGIVYAAAGLAIVVLAWPITDFVLNTLATSAGQVSATEVSGDEAAFTKVVAGALPVVTGLAGVVAVAVMIYGGLQFTTSQGDPGKTQKAKRTLLFGVVGLIVVILAFAIVRFIMTDMLKQ